MEATTDTIMAAIVMPIFFLFLAFIFKLIWDGKKSKLKSDLHHKLVEKFGDVKELNDFLQTESGANFLKSLTIEGVNTKEKLLSSMTKGIIITFLGIGLFLVSPLFPDLIENMKIFNAFGILTIALGIGYMVSTFVSLRLSQKWGIIEKN